MTPDMWIALAAFLILAAAAWILHLAGYVSQARELLARQPATGRHAAKPARSHAKDTPDPAAAQDEPDPFADRRDEDPDEWTAALRGTGEPETAPVPVPVLTAPLPAVLEPLPSSPLQFAAPAVPQPVTADPPPLDRRERAPIPAGALPAWECPVSRGTLESFRDALRAWNPAPAEPETVPEAEPEPEPVPDWLTTSAVNAFAPVLELGDVGRYVDRVFAPAEEAIGVIVAEHLGSEGKGDFAGTSVAGRRDWDLSPVALTGEATS